MKSATTRRLTHKLEYDKWKDRWLCHCGYVLGTGREALYAQCPDAYIEFDITTSKLPCEVCGKPYTPTESKPNHDCWKETKKAPTPPKRQVGRRVARIYRKGQDLPGL